MGPAFRWLRARQVNLTLKVPKVDGAPEAIANKHRGTHGLTAAPANPCKIWRDAQYFNLMYTPVNVVHRVNMANVVDNLSDIPEPGRGPPPSPYINPNPPGSVYTYITPSTERAVPPQPLNHSEGHIPIYILGCDILVLLITIHSIKGPHTGMRRYYPVDRAGHVWHAARFHHLSPSTPLPSVEGHRTEGGMKNGMLKHPN